MIDDVGDLDLYGGFFIDSKACFVGNWGTAVESTLILDAEDRAEESQSWLVLWVEDIIGCRKHPALFFREIFPLF